MNFNYVIWLTLAVSYFYIRKKRKERDVAKKYVEFKDKLKNLRFVSQQQLATYLKELDDEHVGELVSYIIDEYTISIEQGNIKKFEYWIDVLEGIIVYDVKYLNNEYDAYLRDSAVSYTNIITLACKHNRVQFLHHLFKKATSYVGPHYYGNLLTVVRNQGYIDYDLAPGPFYYAIRSGNVQLFNVLIEGFKNWISLNDLRFIIEKAYHQLMLKNVPLSDEIQYLVYDKLLEYDFLLVDHQHHGYDFYDIINRIEKLENIIWKILHCHEARDEGAILNKIKQTARHIHTLKRLLKSTYDRIPWEEMGFCLVIFLKSQKERDGIAHIYNFLLNKEKILNHLEVFSEQIHDVLDYHSLQAMDFKALNVLPSIKRSIIVANIIKINPRYEELYKDFDQVNDLYSLTKISSYMDLALSVNPGKNSHLITLRALQITGEFLKNTLESPKMSTNTLMDLSHTLPDNIREIIIDLRNCSSKSVSLLKKLDMEAMMDNNFINDIKTDFGTIFNSVNRILLNRKIHIIKTVLDGTISAWNLDQLKISLETLNFIEFDEFKSLKIEKLIKLEVLIKEFSEIVHETMEHPTDIFDEIKTLIHSEKSKQEIEDKKFLLTLKTLVGIKDELNSINNLQSHVIGNIKFRLREISKWLSTFNSHSIPSIGSSMFEIFYKYSTEISNSKMNSLAAEICHTMTFLTNDVRCTALLKDPFHCFNTIKKMKINVKTENNITIANLNYKKHLEIKIKTLKHLFKKFSVEKYSSLKNDNKFVTITEMLLLDILSIKKRFEEPPHDSFYLDKSIPLLVGQHLRNHLAHSDAVVDILPVDHQTFIFAYARHIINKDSTSLPKYSLSITYLAPLHLSDDAIIINQSKMLLASSMRCIEFFKECIDNGADVHGVGANLWTALQYAVAGCAHNDMNFQVILEYLFDAGLSPYSKDLHGRNLVHIAVNTGCKNMIEFLIKEKKISIHDADNKGRTPLHVAAENGFENLIVMMLNLKAPSVWDSCMCSPIWDPDTECFEDKTENFYYDAYYHDIFCIKNDNRDLVKYHNIAKYLIENRSYVNAKDNSGLTPLHLAVLNGHINVVKLLITQLADVEERNSSGKTALYYAVEYNRIEIVRLFLAYGVNVNIADQEFNRTPLNLAAENGFEKIVQILLLHKADMNIISFEGLNPFHSAIKNGHINIIKILFKYGIDRSFQTKNGASALHISAGNGHSEITKFLLLETKIKIDAKDCNFNTPLHDAVRNNMIDTANLLIKEKASINCANIYGTTPLHLSSSHGYLGMTKLLIKCGAQINIKDKNKNTPLHLATIGGFVEIVKIMMANKQIINAKNKDGRTALHLAAICGDLELVELLVSSYKANKNSKDNDNRTPLDLALMFNNNLVAISLTCTQK